MDLNFFGRKTPAIFILLSLLLTSCAQRTGGAPLDAVKKESVTKPAPYEIVEAKKADHKATTKPISFYKPKELAALPMVKKFIYKVLVPPTIKENQVKATIDKIIADATARNKDLDEIELVIFSDKKFLNSEWDVATAVWGPKGKMGKVTSATASSNEREEYEVRFHVREHLEEYLDRRDQFQLRDSTDFTDKEEEAIDKILEYKEEQEKKAGKKK